MSKEEKIIKKPQTQEFVRVFNNLKRMAGLLHPG